jgi:hypothetical protein
VLALIEYGDGIDIQVDAGRSQVLSRSKGRSGRAEVAEARLTSIVDVHRAAASGDKVCFGQGNGA